MNHSKYVTVIEGFRVGSKPVCIEYTPEVKEDIADGRVILTFAEDGDVISWEVTLAESEELGKQLLQKAKNYRRLLMDEVADRYNG